MVAESRSARVANTLLQRLVSGALVLHVTADLTVLAVAIRLDMVLICLLAMAARLPLLAIGYWLLRTLERRGRH